MQKIFILQSRVSKMQIFEQFFQKNLHISKKSSTFASDFIKGVQKHKV